LVNLGMSAWLALTWRAQLARGETVLILGATGVAGQLAVQIAKLLGAAKIIAAGRNAQVLSTLPALGADTLISLDQSEQSLIEAIARQADDTGIDVIVDYLWGHPTEAAIAAISRTGLGTQRAFRIRLTEVGESAGPTITLPAAVLRSSGLEIYGSGAGAVPLDRIMEAVPQFMEWAVSAKPRVATEQVPLANVQDAWQRPASGGRRLVIIP
jgi:NADPH2:quinone reductase